MRRVIIPWAGALVAVVALWIGGVIWLNATVYAPQVIVEDYLDALASGDLDSASGLAGLEEVPLIPPDSTNPPKNPRVTGIQETVDGRMLIRAEYLLDGTEESSVFTLEPQAPLWGLFDQWSFSLPPTATITATVSGLDVVQISGLDLPAEQARLVTVLVPGVYTVEASTQWLESPSYSTTVREPESTWQVELDARPSAALVDEVTTALGEYLGECASRQVLQPSSCPFGVRVTDRLYTLPEWTITQMPAVSLEPTSDDSSWDMVALGGEATISATLQSLFDGSLRTYTETVSFALSGEVVGIDTDAPALRID